VNTMTTGTESMAGRRSSERGFTLAEVLVAVTVMAVVFVTVFMLYDSLQKSFKLSENAANQQQNTRVSFDRMVSDVRMAGFNTNPDGDPNRPDEQIEGMWDQAVTVRGDFDYEDPSARTNPESTLGGPTDPFRVVSTGNDEIVTYALGKPGGTGGTSISFVADVTGVPRNGSQETVSINNVYLAQTDPPYTLYRYIVSPNSTSVVAQPVADNIKSLSLTYYDPAGNVLTAVGGAEDANSIAQRKRISKVGIQVVGMTEDPDLAYIDPTDPNAATQHYRKFTLATDVTPRNLGLYGVVDIDIDDPNAPASFTACQGHCNGTYLKWQAPGDPDIASYTVSWGTSVASLTNVVSTTDLHYYVSGITGSHYYAARSIDMVGNQSNNVTVGPSTPTDTTVPGQVSGVGCTGDGGGTLAAVKNQIEVAWAPISGNATNLACDESPYPIRDLKGYRVYKGATSGFNPNNPSQVIQSWDANSIAYNVNALTDPAVVNCRQYYYKIQGEDLCGVTGAFSGASDGASTTNVPPEAPTTVVATDMGLGIHNVTWSRVTTDTDAPPSNITIDKYSIYRAVVDTGNDPNLASYAQVWSGIMSNPASPAFQDPNVPPLPPLKSYYYKIRALDDCPGNASAPSLPAEAIHCNFGGSVAIGISPGGNPVVGSQTITLTASGVPIQSTQLVIRSVATGTVVFNQVDSVAPYQFTWNSASVPAGQDYQIVGIMTNTSGCSETASTTVTTVTAVACCISPTNPNLYPTTGSLKSNEMFFDIVNNCGEDVNIQYTGIEFSNNAGQNALFDEFEFNVLNAITSSRIYNLSPDLPSPFVLDFSTTPLAPPLFLDKNNDASSPVRMRYKFTEPMLNKSGSTYIGETVRTRFGFTIAAQSGIGTCDITVITNPLSVVACDPASDPNCI